MSTGNLAYNPDDTIGAFACTVPQGRYTSARFLDVFKSDKAINKWITVDDLDVLLLRSNPAVQRARAQSAGIHFGRLPLRHKGKYAAFRRVRTGDDIGATSTPAAGCARRN
jgi:hypothetical protein